MIVTCTMETYFGWKSMHRSFKIYFCVTLDWRTNNPARKHSQYEPLRQNWLNCLAGWFHCFQFMVLCDICDIYFETLMHILSSWCILRFCVKSSQHSVTINYLIQLQQYHSRLFHYTLDRSRTVSLQLFQQSLYHLLFQLFWFDLASGH